MEAQLGGGVVSLSKVTIDTGTGGGVDDSSELLLSEVRPACLGTSEGSLKVDLHDDVPVGFRHLHERFVSQDTGVVDEDVDSPEGVDGGLDDVLSELN